MMMNGRPAPRLAWTPLRLSGTLLLLAVCTLFRVPEVPVAAAEGQRPTFQATATRVRVDVIVTDSSGRFVADLDAADFRLFEDDAPQEILSVDVLGERGRVSSQLLASSLREFAAALRRGLAYAASATGGLAYESWSDIDRVLTDIEEESDSYYLLTYEPPARRGDGQHHALRVEVSDAPLQLRYRRGYVDYREGERRELRLEGALTAPGVTRGFPLELASIETTETRGGSIVLEFVGNLPAEARALSHVGGTVLAFAVSGVAIPSERIV